MKSGSVITIVDALKMIRFSESPRRSLFSIPEVSALALSRAKSLSEADPSGAIRIFEVLKTMPEPMESSN